MRISSSSSTTITIPASVCIRYPRRRPWRPLAFPLAAKAPIGQRILETGGALVSLTEAAYNLCMTAFGMALVLVLAGTPKGNAKTSQLKIEVKPPAAVVYVDGKKKGTGASVHNLKLAPGEHTIKIVNRRDEHEEVVNLKPGQTVSWKWTFEDDRTPTPKSNDDKEVRLDGEKE
jgi:hypothetical protein